MDKYTDGQLYIRYLYEEDQDAFRILYEKYKDGIILFLFGIVKNIDDAEELMMDTFAVLASKTANYKERKNVSFKTWLFVKSIRKLKEKNTKSVYLSFSLFLCTLLILYSSEAVFYSIATVLTTVSIPLMLLSIKELSTDDIR